MTSKIVLPHNERRVIVDADAEQLGMRIDDVDQHGVAFGGPQMRINRHDRQVLPGAITRGRPVRGDRQTVLSRSRPHVTPGYAVQLAASARAALLAWVDPGARRALARNRC